eukprot:TRINITY_DN23829_c0_g1_i1.p1 TRINITY_DN23829_c0_g1~~TRINITY_DN23829_c0_g1_i1.p1  ORF type:complete len:582 (+),score=84.09 TRINITY_DN23829_c0_g1_i1:260-2005(+)
MCRLAKPSPARMAVPLPGAGGAVSSSAATSSSARVNKDEVFPRSVSIAGHDVILESQLGKGSFGTVYKAYRKGQRLALKEIKCASAKERIQAELEVKYQKQLTFDGDARVGTWRAAQSPGCCACPRFVATDTLNSAHGHSVVRILMERVDGMPLDNFTKCSSRHLPYVGAMAMVSDLVRQMLPTLEQVSKLCVHRDVNAHNILVNTPSLARSTSNDAVDVNSFNLIDFGLATDAMDWVEGQWKSKDIAGDCRYWPVSCWKQFLFGYKYLMDDDGSVDEYKYNLDAHSFALTCIQFLGEVTVGGKPAHARDLFDAWERYWADAQKFHKDLYAVFQGQGTWAALKKQFLQENIVNKTRANLDRLKHALETCDAGEDSNTKVLCQILARLLSGRRVDWSALQVSLNSVPETATSDDALGDLADFVAPLGGSRKLSHRRQRTTDSGASMSRHVPEVGNTCLLRFDGETSNFAELDHIAAAASSAATSGTQPIATKNGPSSLSPSGTPPALRVSHRRMRSAGPDLGVGIHFSFSGLDEFETPKARLRKITESDETLLYAASAGRAQSSDGPVAFFRVADGADSATR